MITDELTELMDEDVERQALGLLMLAPQELPESGLSAEDFVINAHKTIFREIAAMASHEGAIEPMSLISGLKQAGKLESVGGSAGIWEIMNGVVMFHQAHFQHCVTVLSEYKALRMLRKISHQVSQMVINRAESEEIARIAQGQLGELTASKAGMPWRLIAEYTKEAIEKIDQAAKGQAPARMKTGLSAVDRRFYQILDPGNLVIVAGRPSMGKTSLALGVALSVAQQEKVVGFASLEMPGFILAQRAMLLNSEHLSVSALDHGTLTDLGWKELVYSCEGLSTAPIYLTDQPRLSMPLLVRKAKELKRTKGLDVLMVDYLQLMELGEANTINDSIRAVTREMKILAMELLVPIVLLSQLSRKCEDRADKRPILSDLRDSGAIEQDADVVWMVYRDEVYDKDTPDAGVAEMLMRKNRNGPIGEERVRFIPHRTKFEDL